MYSPIATEAAGPWQENNVDLGLQFPIIKIPISC